MLTEVKLALHSLVMTQHAQVWVLNLQGEEGVSGPQEYLLLYSSWQKFPPDIKDVFYALVHSSDRFA